MRVIGTCLALTSIWSLMAPGTATAQNVDCRAAFSAMASTHEGWAAAADYSSFGRLPQDPQLAKIVRFYHYYCTPASNPENGLGTPPVEEVPGFRSMAVNVNCRIFPRGI